MWQRTTIFSRRSPAIRRRRAAAPCLSGRYFDVLELSPAAGRLIGPQDTPRVGESDVAVLGYEYWQSRFGGDAAVVGETLTVNNRALTIVGVAPEAFGGTLTGFRPQLFVPLTLRWAMQPEMPRDEDNRQAYWLSVFARLQPGVDVAVATDIVNRRYAAILAEVEAPLLTGVSEAERADSRAGASCSSRARGDRIRRREQRAFRRR